jgi:hypothetical protein
MFATRATDSSEAAVRERPVSLWPYFVFPPLLLLGICWLLSVLYLREAKKDWEICQAELAAIGESLDIEDLRPKVSDPARNIAAAPIFAEVLAELRANPDLDLKAHPVFGPIREDAVPGYVARHEQKDENGFPAPKSQAVILLSSPPLAESFPNHTELEAARAILAHGAAHRDTLMAIAEAARRPESDFGIRYEDGIKAHYPHLNPVLDLSKFLRLHARAALIEGDPATAANDVITILRIAAHISSEPPLLCSLVGTAVHSLAIPTIREGLATSAWREMDKRAFALELSKAKHLADLAHSLRMERAMYATWLENAQTGIYRQERLTGWNGEAILFGAFPVLREAWIYDNASAYNRLMQSQISLIPVDRDTPVDLQAREQLRERLEEMSEPPFRLPRHSLTTTTFPIFLGIESRTIRSATHSDLARLALALDIVRQLTGRYPETLEACRPHLVGEFPLDLYTGENFLYRPLPNDDYLLYGIGQNAIDDGGLLKHHVDLGDWVWRLRLPEDFDYEEYSRR